MNVGRWYNWSSYISFFFILSPSVKTWMFKLLVIFGSDSLSNISVDEPFKEWIYKVPQKNVDFKEGKKV